MSKKIIMVCMAVAAFAAFALPATASAKNTPHLTDSGGAVAVGAAINGTLLEKTEATFWNTATSIKLFTCTNSTLTGKIVKNTTGTVEGTITTFDFSGTGSVHADNGLNECTGDIGSFAITVVSKPLCLRATEVMLTHEFQVGAELAGKTCAEGTGNVKFLLISTTAGECEYETAGSVKGDFTTTAVGTASRLTTRDTIAGSGASRIRGGFLCPSSGMLGITFTMETEAAGNPVISITS
jgi:hypothetical protein